MKTLKLRRLGQDWFLFGDHQGASFKSAAEAIGWLRENEPSAHVIVDLVAADAMIREGAPT
jgi:hypothetical protein